MGAPENPPAFPLPDGADLMGRDGMTLRDWFAGQTLPSVLGAGVSMEGADPKQFQSETRQIAVLAYAIADAMLAARTVQS